MSKNDPFRNMHDINKAVEKPKRSMVIKGLFVLLFILLAIIVIFAAVLIIPKLLGYKEYRVKSHDMEPELTSGTLIFVKEEDPKDLKTGDIITYTANDGSVVTHRIVEIDREKEVFYTQGDAAPSRDTQPVRYSQVIGKLGFKIPWIGKLLFWL